MKRIILFLLSASLSLLCLDVFMKQAKITPPVLKYYNDTFGSLNRPNLNYLKSIEGFFMGHTNAEGRFRENYSRKKDGRRVLRIALVGDSFVEGIDVLSRNHFASYMERLLSEKLQQPVEILNFGRGNCVLQASSYYFINSISTEYDADIVLYFTEFRDILPSTDYPSTTFHLDSAERLQPDYSWRNTAEYRLHSKLIRLPILKYYEDIAITRLAYRAWGRIKSRGIPSLVLGKFYGMPAEQDYSYAKADVPLSDVSKKIYDTLATSLRGQMIFVTRNLPTDAFMIRDYLKKIDSKYIDLSDTLDQQFIRGTAVNAHFFRATQSYGGHWNNEGHKAVGYFLTNAILRDLRNYNMPLFQDEH